MFRFTEPSSDQIQNTIMVHLVIAHTKTAHYSSMTRFWLTSKQPKIHTDFIWLEMKIYLFGTPLYVVLIMT